MDKVFNNSIFTTFLNNFESQKINTTVKNENKSHEFYSKSKKFLDLIISKVKCNKKIKIQIINLYLRLIKIFEEEKNNKFSDFSNREIITALILIIMKEKLGIKIGFVFELETDLIWEDLNEVLNIFYMGLVEQKSQTN